MAKAKKIEPVTAVFLAAGRPCDYNRRNRWFRALSQILESGLVTFELCALGKTWHREKPQPGQLEQYNIVVRGLGLSRVGYHNSRQGDIDPYDVLRHVGKFLQNPQVKEKILSHVNLDLTCDRCGGEGYIRQFHYYCDGICFECYGSGYSAYKKTTVEIIGKAKPETPKP